MVLFFFCWFVRVTVRTWDVLFWLDPAALPDESCPVFKAGKDGRLPVVFVEPIFFFFKSVRTGSWCQT